MRWWNSGQGTAAGRANLISGMSRDVDFVILCCPNCSLEQAIQLVRMLEGRHIKDGVFHG